MVESGLWVVSFFGGVVGIAHRSVDRVDWALHAGGQGLLGWFWLSSGLECSLQGRSSGLSPTCCRLSSSSGFVRSSQCSWSGFRELGWLPALVAGCRMGRGIPDDSVALLGWGLRYCVLSWWVWVFYAVGLAFS
jgi:hypothetical protein